MQDYSDELEAMQDYSDVLEACITMQRKYVAYNKQTSKQHT
jgi:hypothetical protein